MKESRFIELLNLYVDRQITPDEVAELEAELQRDPKRQAVYRQYCRIHTATKHVYESFRSVADQSTAAPAGKTGVVELFESRRRRSRWAYYTGGFAVAACLALVFALNRNPASPSAAPALAAITAPVPAVAAASVEPVRVAIAEPSPVSLRHSVVTVTPDYAAMLAALREQDEERDFHNERTRLGRMQPLFNDSMFEPARVLSAQDQRVFRSQPSVTPVSAQQTEFSAFQFQR